MADAQCSTDPAHGVEITEYFSQSIYLGDETALIAAGVIRSEWVAGLGAHSRAIVLEPDGGFTVIREGVSGNYVTHALRRRGLFSLRRRKDGLLRVIKYRTPEEERLRELEWKRKREALEAGKERASEETTQRLKDALESLLKPPMTAHKWHDDKMEQALAGLDSLNMLMGHDAYRYHESAKLNVLRRIGELRQAVVNACATREMNRFGGGKVIYLQDRERKA